MPDDKTQDHNREASNAPTLFSDEVLAGWIERCDPSKPLNPSTDERYVDLGFVDEGGERVRLRGDDHIEQMYDTVHLQGVQSCQLFSGFSGTGKSIELRRLKSRLEADGYVVLLADAHSVPVLEQVLRRGSLSFEASDYTVPWCCASGGVLAAAEGRFEVHPLVRDAVLELPTQSRLEA